MKQLFLSSCLLSLLIACFSGSSWAEKPTRANVHYKKLKVILDGMYSQGFSDNVALMPTNREGGARTNLKGMVGLQLPIKISETNLKFFTNLVLNSGKNTKYDVKSFSFLLAEKIKLGQYIQFITNGNLTRAQSFNPISDTLPVDILSARVRCTGAIKSKKRLSFVSTYSFTNEHNYTGDNYRENANLSTAWVKLTPKTAWLLTYNFTQGYYLSGETINNTTNSHFGRTGLRFAKILKRLNGQFGFGVRHAKSTLYSIPDTKSEGPGFNFRLGDAPVFADFKGNVNADLTKAKLGLTVDFGVRPTFATNRLYTYPEPDTTGNLVYLTNPFVSILGSKFSAAWKVVSRFSITSSLAGELRNYPVGSRQDTYIKQANALEWNMRKYFYFTLFYMHTNNTSDIDRYIYRVNEFGITLSAKF